jgi:DNA modification methylase
MNIVQTPISKLTLDPNNARKHSEKNLRAIAASLEKFGQRKPIVVHRGVVIAGNGTVEAAKSLGWTDISIAAVPDEWDADTAKAYALADNRSAELAEWDESELAKQLLELQDADWDITELGFDVPALADIEPVDEDEIPEPPVEPKTKLGDIYQLGRHRLMCGDSTDSASVERLMDGTKADMVFTDPPYGMDLDTDYTKMGDGGKKHDKVIADNKQFNAQFLLQMFDYCDEIFLWGADYYIETINRQYPDLGSWIIWDKYSDANRNGLLDGRFGSSFETCWSKTKHKREIARVLVTTNYTARGDETRIHPTQKPVALAQWFFERWAKDGTNIVDLFLGSGSTLIACEQTGKTCFGMELDPKYCDVIVTRWENLTGNQATLVNSK